MTEEIKKEEEKKTETKIEEEVKTDERHKHGLFRHKCNKCEELEKQCEEFKSGWQRALADYKNLQREVEQRRGEWAQMSEAQILEEFLPVYDNFKKAFNTTDFGNTDHTDIVKWENWKKGIQYIMQQFGSILKAHGIEEIKTVGEKFDPRFHEAIGEEESEGSEPGTILKEVEGGYKRGDKVIKPARVIVSK